MARSKTPGDHIIYESADRWIEVALRGSDSLFTPGRAIWSEQYLDELDQRFVQNPDDSQDPFEVKLERQIRDASPEAIQLMSEVMFIHFLAVMPAALKGDTKRNQISRILGWSPRPVEVPADLDPVLDRGLTVPGVAYFIYRASHLQLLIEFSRGWKNLDSEEQERMLNDAWAFREYVHAMHLPRGAKNQREALLHLVHPDTFEQIVSEDMKARIAEAFSEYVSDPAKDVDHQLLEIRRRLEETHGSGFQYWEPRLRELW